MSKFHQFLMIEQYLFSIRIKLLYSPKRKREIIKDFRSFIYSCMRENPEDTVTCKQDLYDLFGTVDRVVKNNMALQDAAEVKEYKNGRKRIKILLLPFAVLLVFFIIILIWSYWMHEKNIEIFSHVSVIVETSVAEEGR